MAAETLSKEEYLLGLVKSNNHEELRKEILHEDITLKEAVANLTYTNGEGEKEPLVGRLLFNACDDGRLECACILADCCGETVINQLYRYTTANGVWRGTPLHKACRMGQIDIAKHLVKCKAKVDKTDDNGDLPVHDTAWKGHVEVVKYLLDLQPDTISVKGMDGFLPVHYAAGNGQLEVVKYLLDLQPDTISAKNDYGNLPVHESAMNGHLEVVKYLLDLQPDTISVKNNDGDLPVHHAASKGHGEVVKYLLELQPDTLSVKDKNGSLPVHSAAENGHLEVVKYLLNLQPDTISAKNDYGNLPVHRAAFKGHLELVKYLLDLQPDTISAKNNVGRTPLGEAVCAGEAGCVPYLLDVTWAMLPYDEANEIVEEVRRIAEKKESMPILNLIKASLICAECGIEGYSDPTELIANVCGEEGSGKSTFISSFTFTAKGFFNALLRKENQPDMKANDLASRTKGIEETMWKQSQVNVRFRDFAGHDHYSASHDFFAVSMTAPSVATIVVDGTESVEEITKRVSATAASYACRQSTSDDGSELDGQQQQPMPLQLQLQSHTQQAGGHEQKLDVVAVATRADLLTPFQRGQVERAIVEGMKSCSQRLELAFVRVVDARKSNSSSMKELRTAFLHLVHKVLAKSPRQHRLVQKADDYLDEVKASLSNPYCTRKEFVAAFQNVISQKAASRRQYSVRERVAENISSCLRILTAYGYIITFPELDDLVVHNRRWLLQDVIGFMYSSNVFPLRPDGIAREYKISEEEFVRSLTAFAKVGEKATLCVRMALQLGLSIRSQKDILALSLLPECTQPLKMHRAFRTSQVMVGSVHTCTTAAVAATMTRTATALGTVATRESSTSETCQAAVIGSTAEPAAATAAPPVNVADTVTPTVAATADVTAASTATVADTMMQTATAMDTVATRESSTSETCQAAVTGSRAEAAVATATPTVSVADTVSSTVPAMAEVTAAATGTVADTMMQMATAMGTVTARESSTSETCQAAVTGITEAAAATATPTVSVAHTVSSTVAATADTVTHEATATTTLADNVAHTVAATAEVTAVATGTVADTMMQTATGMYTVAARESSTSETCQAAVTGITDNPFDTGTFTSRILLKLCEIPCATFRRSVQKQGLLPTMAEIHELLRAEKYETVENHNVKIIGYIHPGGMDSYKKLCAAIKGLKYEALYTEMIVLLPAHRQPRDD
ncbi:uncharacterized protein LOC135825830 isoform X2 [Sycon ciliatum]|uniref:uncharacterized protein LOC135825830 isoform X2 n=1 Tax=Sycon ciliatum TaxID=27933 RepID=UPI0031F6BAAC